MGRGWCVDGSWMGLGWGLGRAWIGLGWSLAWAAQHSMSAEPATMHALTETGYGAGLRYCYTRLIDGVGNRHHDLSNAVRQHVGLERRAGWAAWPPGCLAAWPPGRLAAWPPGRLAACLDALLPSCLAASLPRRLTAWLPGCLAASLPGSLASNLQARLWLTVGMPSTIVGIAASWSLVLCRSSTSPAVNKLGARLSAWLPSYLQAYGNRWLPKTAPG